MLRRKEQSDINSRDQAMDKQNQLYGMKRDVQQQIIDRERLRE